MPGTRGNIQEYYRYCPGEERIKISDAVCLGRRRNNFPKCKGCQFNDDEQATGESRPQGPGAGDAVENEDSKRDRLESVFVSDGVRGTWPEPLDAELAWRVGLATAQLLRSELRGYDRSRPEKAAVAVGTDMRKSSPALRDALSEGLRAGGSPVIDLGMIDSPQLGFAIRHLTCCGGVQVTGSRHPANVNGFKILGAKARPVDAETGLGKIRTIAKNTVRHASPHVADLSREDLSESYRSFVRRFLKTPRAGLSSDRPLKIVMDASNGMAGHWIPIVFDDVDWLEIVRLNFEHNGDFVHDPDPTREANLAQLKDRCVRAKAHFGVCFDGDADRLALVDDRGEVVPDDLTIALIARYLVKANPGAAVACDLRASRVVAEEVAKAGGVVRRERAQPAFLRKSLIGSKGVVAAELGGRYYFRDNACSDSALIALCEMINILAESGRPLHELLNPLQRYARSGCRLFESDNPSLAYEVLADTFADANIDYRDGLTVEYEDWWFSVSGEEQSPFLQLRMEAADSRQLEARLAQVAPFLGKPVTV